MANPAQTSPVTNDADTQFERLVREPRIAISLMTAVIVTAIIWLTTFIATVSSAAAYLVQVTASPTADEPFQPLSAAPSLAERAVTTTASRPKNFPTDELLQSGIDTQQSAATQVLRIPPPAPKLSAQTLAAVSTPAPQNVEVRTENATAAAVRSAHDQIAASEQASVAETAAAAQGEDKRCPDGFWGGLCRERMRWNNCHPDKWDVTPECTVQKFNSYNLQ